MNSDWEPIGEKVFSLYKKMEYRADESDDYSIEQFQADLKIEKEKNLAQLLNREEEVQEEEDEEDEVRSDFQLVTRFRKVIEYRRSILNKFFSFGNYLNGVNTLIEYCDYVSINCNVEQEWFVQTCEFSYIFTVIVMYLGQNKKVMEKKLPKKVLKLLEYDMELDFSDNILVEDDCYGTYFVKFGSTAIVIMADSDLNAAVNALIKWKDSSLGVSHILVQEPIREKFVNTIPDQDNRKWIIDNLFVFRNIGEAIGYLNSLKKLRALSVWSENIISAKNFAADLEVDTIWINTHGDISPGLRSISYYSPSINHELQKKSDNSSKNIRNTLKTVDLFYGGKWEVPIEGKYWTDESGVSIAQATRKDIDKCSVEARKAFKIWRSTKLSQRIKVVKLFAERVRAHGESEYADKILQFANSQFLDLGNTLSIVRDGEAEITTTLKPAGVILFYLDNQEDLFQKLSIAVLTGNTVILVIENRKGVTFSPYCDMLASSGFPPGVINCLFVKEYLCFLSGSKLENINRVIEKSFQINDHPSDRVLLYFTKPQSVWLQRG